MKLFSAPLFCLLAILLLAAALPRDAAAQRSRLKQKLREQRLENWPPEQTYRRLSLGYSLQHVFEKHFNFCGFKAESDRRDFIPQDISKFLGRRDLRTEVEMADISGGGLFNYIFGDLELSTPLNAIRYQTANLLDLDGLPAQFMLDPDERFDAFVLTKNCSGYLKAALDAGIEPPYAAFKSALSTDSRRESSVIAISGSFANPIREILAANDDRTTELMLRLWQFYRERPEYAGYAYYLQEFEGVMIKHLTTANDIYSLESEIGVNINGPIGAHLKAGLSTGRAGGGSFSGTDWETIVYTDFEGPYTREQLYAPLPTPADIEKYFAGLRPIFEKPKDFPLLTEGAEHKHYLIVPGIPEEICRLPWVIEQVNAGVYADGPRLQVDHYVEPNGRYGCRFTVIGRPQPTLFAGPRSERPGTVPLSYRIRSQEPVMGHYLSFYLKEELATSAHPIVSLENGHFDLSKREDRRFAFLWQFTLEVEDRENPVDFSVPPFVSNLQIRRSDQQIEANVTRVFCNEQKKECYISIETRETWPLDKIDDRNMVNYNLAMDVHLQTNRGQVRNVRPVKGILSFPSIRPDAPPPVPRSTEVAPLTLPAPPPGGTAPLELLPPPTSGGGSGSSGGR